MSRLDLRFLGTPEVWCEHQPLKFPTRKSLALLIYLAMCGGWHSREKLIALLWPESDTQRGQASLRNALVRLRQTLGEAEDYLLIEADRLSFDLSAGVTLDWQQVAQATDSQDMAVLQKAINLYRGDFLEGFSLSDAPAFDEWASLQREYWHRLLSNVLARLCRLQTDAAQIKKGLVTALRWTAHDPLNEAAYQHLIELHALAGDRTAALQAYETCRAILEAELSVEPSPGTEALAEQIKSEKQGSRGAREPSPVLPRSFAPSLPFVGRSVKHLQLVTAFHAARQGRTQVVIIEGEAGIGKTRLAMEFLAWTATHQGGILRGRALDAGGRLPYQPIVDALRPRIEMENAPEDLLSDVWLAELSRLLPELHDRYPDLPPPVEDPNLARTRLPEAITRLGQALAKRQQPLVIFIDDAQWADVASLDLLHHCSRAWAQAATPVLLLLTLRLETIPALQEWLANLERTLPVQRQGLAPLTQEDTRQLGQSLVNQDDAASRVVAHRFGDWLFTQTEGQPFFINETIKEMVDRGVLQDRFASAGIWAIDLAVLETWLATGSSITPKSVRQLITTRLHRLTPGASALLTAAAVLGQNCSYAWLGQVADVDELTGLSGLDELLNAHLLIESQKTVHPYTIAHDKIREVVYNEAGAARRRVFHRRAFEALEKAVAEPSESGQRVAELAYHALGAHLSEPAFRYSVAAGDNALALFAVHNAITHYEQARHQLAISNYQLPITNLYLNLGRAYELAGDLERAEAVYQELLKQAETSGQIELTCTTLNRLAIVAVHIHKFEAALDYLTQAKDIAKANNNKTGLTQTEWSLAQLHHHRFNFQRSLVHSQRTLKLARQLEDKALVAGSLNALAYAHMFLGQVGEGEIKMAEARARYAELGNKALEADCLTAIAAAQLWLGHIQDGIETARAAETICAKIENPWGHIYSQVWLATGLLDNGNYEAALAVAQAGQNQARAHNLPPMSMFIALVLGKIYRTVGQLEAAYEIHLEASALNKQVKSEVYMAFIGTELCADCALSGNWPEAAAHARQALAQRRYDILPLVISPHWLQTEALLRGGDVELAREDARRWGEIIGRVPRFRVGYLRSLAVLAEWDGLTEQTITHLQEALALAEQIGLPEEQWQILEKLGELYRAGDDKEKAQSTFAQAKEIVRTLAIRIDDEGLRAKFTGNRGI